MDLRKLKTLIELVQESGIAELEVTEGEEKVRITRTVANTMQPFMQYAAPMMAAMPSAAPAAAAPVAAAAPAAAPAAPAEPAGHAVKSPMVGTFYRSASPTDKPFVNVGDTVDENTTVCIIEAMKVMNEIKAEARGTVVRILVDDAKPVQYGQPLFELK